MAIPIGTNKILDFHANPVILKHMNREQELKDLIEALTDHANAGHIQARQQIINAQIELDEINDTRFAQEVFEQFVKRPQPDPIVT
jgi:hypothetical protein